MLTQKLSWLLELILLTAAIHVFLRIVRQTRGNRLVRGFLVTVLLVAVALFGLVDTLELEELGHILESATGYVAVVLAIMFQPELRRAISQLGTNPFLSSGGVRVTASVLGDLAGAARSMAKRRHGALIAISGESPLQTIIEKATRLDAPVTRSLVESIFQPGGVLHDGGVVVSDDRVVAAQCIFPLSDSTGLGAWSGTRHRAALGLSEETDAVILAVSEETGRISLFQGGKRRGPIPPDGLLDALRETVGSKAPSGTGTSGRLGSLRELPRRLGNELGWIGLSATLAAGILFVVHGQIAVSQERTLRLELVGPSDVDPPLPGELLLRAPSDDWTLTSDLSVVDVAVLGTRRQLDRLGTEFGGEIELLIDESGRTSLAIDAVRWIGTGPGLSIRWPSGRNPSLRLAPLVERTFALNPDSLPLDLTRVDPRFRWERASTVITPDQVVVRGPREVLDRLGEDGPRQLLRPAPLSSSARGRTTLRLPLRAELLEAGVELAFGKLIEVELELVPSARDVGVVEREITIACLDQARREELGRWTLELHARTARVRVRAEGLLPQTATGADAQRVGLLRRFVEAELRVYVDVAELDPDGASQSLPVRWVLRRDWRDALSEVGLEGVELTGDERLELILESDESVFLVPAGAPGDEN
ncbi:MAG: diadenylate cyclase [Planctomycetota bacterium]